MISTSFAHCGPRGGGVKQSATDFILAHQNAQNQAILQQICRGTQWELHSDLRLCNFPPIERNWKWRIRLPLTFVPFVIILNTRMSVQ